ncbi:MAG TPA: hypothetical protein VNW50_03150 [Streptosporangiaceae bacterium]|nr:hypothetical protein [Streptosporangiaceae bacterium]
MTASLWPQAAGATWPRTPGSAGSAGRDVPEAAGLCILRAELGRAALFDL